MNDILEAGDDHPSPLKSPSSAKNTIGASTRRLTSTRSLLSSSSSPSRSERNTSMSMEMSIMEQIARRTRKSTVLDEKNALLILAIPDYDDYKILQPYSCRSLSSKSKFVGDRDFITRHNPQAVNDFKKEYSRDVGNLNRHRSIVSPPTGGVVAGSQLSKGSLAFIASQSWTTATNQSENPDVWKKIFTSSHRVCWVLTEFGIHTLLGPEYSITTRIAVLPSLGGSLTCRSPHRPETSVSVFSARESAQIGMRVDLSDEKRLASLSRTAAYSPNSQAPSPLRSPFREPVAQTTQPSCKTLKTTKNQLNITDYEEFRSLSPYIEAVKSPTSGSIMNSISPTLQPFALEISPPSINLGHIQRNEVYLFPMRVRNVGKRQERFRVRTVNATSAGIDAVLTGANYDKDNARLAPGLATIVTITLSFAYPGKIVGKVQVETEDIGSWIVSLNGVVR